MLCLFLQKWLRNPVHGAGRMSRLFPGYPFEHVETDHVGV